MSVIKCPECGRLVATSFAIHDCRPRVVKIKPQFIGKDLNLPNLADQSVAKLKSLRCWGLYASGKASIGRKSSMIAIRKILLANGHGSKVNEFLSDVIERMRLEQRAEDGKS